MITFKVSTIEELEVKLLDFKILFAYHSNKIENEKINYHDTYAIFNNKKVIIDDLQALFEIQNQKDCFEFLKEKIVSKEPLSIGLIKQIHKLLTKNTYDQRRYLVNSERPGEFKKHDYVTGINEVGNSPDEVEEDLKSLIEEINEYEGANPLTIVAYFHAVFENIHPFADGNGRVGRTLINYYLMTHDLAPMIIYEQDKKIYYDALEKFDVEQDLKPLQKFLEYEQEKTWKKKSEKKASLTKFIEKDKNSSEI